MRIPAFSAERSIYNRGTTDRGFAAEANVQPTQLVACTD